MNLCFYGNFTGRGAEKATLDIANLLEDEHSIVVLNSNDQELKFQLSQGVSYRTLRRNSVARMILELAKFLKQNRIDILIAVEALTGITAMPAAKIVGCKIVIWDHGNYFQTKGSRFAKITRQIECLCCDAVVLLTKRDVRNYQEHFNHIRTKLIQIYNYVSIDTSWVYNNKSKTIISIGHIDSNKNFSIIPEIAKFAFEDDDEWVWKIYGSGTQGDIEKIQESIRFHKMEKNVHICGFSEKIDDIYNDAGICVMTSKYEGFPLVLIEAKAHGIPLVSFNIDTGPDEIIENETNGFLINHYDIKEMASKVKMLVMSEEMRIRFSRESHRGLSKLRSEEIKSQWMSLLRSI